MLEVLPGKAVSIIECDMKVSFCSDVCVCGIPRSVYSCSRTYKLVLTEGMIIYCKLNSQNYFDVCIPPNVPVYP